MTFAATYAKAMATYRGNLPLYKTAQFREWAGVNRNEDGKLYIVFIDGSMYDYTTHRAYAVDEWTTRD
jgi:hypothetical protein